MTVFADTFALIAWLNPQDATHSQVAAYLNGFTGRLLTTEWVLVELAYALSAPFARSTAVAFLQAVRADPLFEVIGYSDPVFQAGFAIFANRPDKGWPPQIVIRYAATAPRLVCCPPHRRYRLGAPLDCSFDRLSATLG